MNIVASSKDFFIEQVDRAFQMRKMETIPIARQYLVDLLEHYVSAQNLFDSEDPSGKVRRTTLAEMYLTAQQAPTSQRVELLKKLGDTSLYVSGFFGDSLKRKVVDLDYYMDMGAVAYHSLSGFVNDDQFSELYKEFGGRFVEFVDILTYISNESLVRSNEDLLRLYDRYILTGSKLAEEQLLEKGVLSADLPKVKIVKQ